MQYSTAVSGKVGRSGIKVAPLLALLLLTMNVGLAKDVPPELEDLEKISISDTMVMVPMRDGVRLATDIYRPKDADSPVPIIFVKTPYNFNKLGNSHIKMAIEAVKRGYAFVIQNERGRYYSEGEWEILGQPRTDGYDSLTWLAEQKWSSGSVGTLGCSSSAEWQLALASQNHPAHKAMVPMAAGAGIGRVGEFYEQGNWYKGGVHQTLFDVWLYSVQQDIRPAFPKNLDQKQRQRMRKLYDLAPEMPKPDWKKVLRTLPATSWLSELGANDGPDLELLKRKPNDPGWYNGGLYHDNDDFGVPAFWFNSWFDVSQGPNLALYNHVRKNASDADVRNGQYVLIAPTLHCGFSGIPKDKDLIVGELNVGDASFALNDQLFGWFDYYLKGESNRFPAKTPRVQYYTMGKNEWAEAEHWPPKAAKSVSFYLSSGGKANSLFGDGSLTKAALNDTEYDAYTYDPMNPVPSLGGGVCCNSGAAPGGSYDQRAIEARADVLVYTSAELDRDTEVTGSISSVLYVSADVRDTDFTVKLVDVHPDGTAYNVDDSILRSRYRDGYDKEVFMQEGQVYEITLPSMSTSYQFKKGHRIRVEVSSSKFPQYMRNLNTGGNNIDESTGVVAHNRIYHSAKYPSRVILPIMP